MSHISQHTAVSRSSSSNHVGPMAVNMFANSNQTVWPAAGAPTPMNSGYMVGGYDTPSGYDVSSAVPTQTPCSIPQLMGAEVQIMDSQSVNPGDLHPAEMGDMNSPPMVNYRNNGVLFKPESVDYSYESAQMYQQVLTQPVYPSQHEPPVVRTAAGGECDGLIKFEEPSDYEQPFDGADAEAYGNYDMVQNMAVAQHVHTVAAVE
ncbi:unnamed protein product, partial [Strongylus vulgaris]